MGFNRFSRIIVLPAILVLGVVGSGWWILQTSTSKNVPVIMLTALVDSTELSEGAVGQAGTSMVLPKPVNLALLLRLLHDVIGDDEKA